MANYWEDSSEAVIDQSVVSTDELFSNPESDGERKLKKVNNERPHGIIIEISDDNYVNYSKGMLTKGKDSYQSDGPNPFLAKVVALLDKFRTLSNGRKVVDPLSDAETHYFLFVDESSQGGAFEFKPHNNLKGGTIKAHTVITGTGYGETNLIDGFSHELYHAFENLSGVKKRTLNRELAGFLFGIGVGKSFTTTYKVPLATGNSDEDVQFLQNVDTLLSASSFDNALFQQTVQLWPKTQGVGAEYARRGFNVDKKENQPPIMNLFPLIE